MDRKLRSDLGIGVVVLLFVSLHLFTLVLFNRLYLSVVLALGASHKLRFFVRGNHVSQVPSDFPIGVTFSYFKYHKSQDVFDASRERLIRIVDSSSFNQNYSSSTSTISIILNDRVPYQRSVFVVSSFFIFFMLVTILLP